MPAEPSGVSIYSPKIRDQALVRRFVSQNGRGYVAISIQNGADPVDPDEGTLKLTVYYNDVLSDPAPADNPYGTAVMEVTQDSLTRDDEGKFHFTLGPELTANRGLLTAIWTYEVNAVAFQFVDHLQVLEQMPLYETLSDEERGLVEQVTWMFGDLYDSTEGGPHLIEEFQTHWGYERIAQIMRLAVNKMNYIGNYGNAPTTWSIGTSGGSSSSTTSYEVQRPDGSTLVMQSSSSGGFRGNALPGNMAGLAVWGTYLEVMRHLRDSYTEIPNRPGMDVTYTDRRDYYSRWASNLQAEEQNWRQAVKSAKISGLNLSRGSLLVAGGIYGGSARGVFQAGTYAAQVRSWRFYPAAPAISWGATAH